VDNKESRFDTLFIGMETKKIFSIFAGDFNKKRFGWSSCSHFFILVPRYHPVCQISPPA
jgi:hypothetical protein